MVKCIAMGNRIMMDDGIAIAVVEILKDMLKEAGVEVIIGETDFQFCYDQINDGDFLIIIDAAYNGKMPGEITFYTLQEAVNEHRKPYSQHEISLFDLIEFYPKDIDGYIIGIEVAGVDFGLGLSDSLKSKFDFICTQVEEAIIKIMETGTYA